jgi:hypothetical protein
LCAALKIRWKTSSASTLTRRKMAAFTSVNQDAVSLCEGDNYRTLLITRSVGATPKDVDAITEVVRYLKSTAHLELTYKSAFLDQCNIVGRLYEFIR